MLRYLIALSVAVVGCCWTALFYRPLNTYLNHQLATAFGEDFLLLRAYIQGSLPLSDVLVYNVPGALWIFGLSLLGWRLFIARIPLFYVGLVTGQLFEVLQLLQLTDGTFDVLDVLWNFGGFLVALVFCKSMPHDWRTERGMWRYVLFFVVLFAAFGVDVLG